MNVQTLSPAHAAPAGAPRTAPAGSLAASSGTLPVLRRALQALRAGLRRTVDPVADCVREAAAVRREALRLMERHPAMAADLYAAADRHEREACAPR
jgi:uncharacterized membrane protein